MKTLPELIRFFEIIPDSAWCVNLLEDRNGRRCALGHLSHHIDGHALFMTKSSKILYDLGITREEIAGANNGEEDHLFKCGKGPFSREALERMGKTPKERVLFLLKEKLKQNAGESTRIM